MQFSSCVLDDEFVFKENICIRFASLTFVRVYHLNLQGTKNLEVAFNDDAVTKPLNGAERGSCEGITSNSFIVFIHLIVIYYFQICPVIQL